MEEDNSEEKLKQAEKAISKRAEENVKSAGKKVLRDTGDLLKKLLLRHLIHVLIIVAIIILVIVLLASISYYLKISDGTHQEGNWKNTGYVVSQKATGTVNISNIQGTVSSGYTLGIDLDAKVEEVLKTLQTAEDASDFEGDIISTSVDGSGDGTRLAEYLSEENRKEYLRDFIKAEIITQYPDLRQNPDAPLSDGEVQGIIKIKRAQADGSTRTLTYVDQDTFNSYIDKYNNNGDTTAINYFTLNNSGDIVVAKWNKTETTFYLDNGGDSSPDTKDPSNNEEYKSGTEIKYVMSKVSINYKSMVEKYSMPFDFLWALLVMTEDEEFVHDVSKLALDSEIVFTVNDNKTTTKTEDVYTYKKQTKTKTIVNAIITATIGENDISKRYKKDGEKENSPVDYKITKTIIEEDTIPVIDLTYANTWITEYKNNYTNKIENGNKEVKEPIKKNDINYKKISENELTKNANSQSQMLSDSFVNSALEEAKAAMKTEKESEILEKEIEKLLEQKIEEKSDTSVKGKIFNNVITEVKQNILTAMKARNYSDDLFSTWNINNRIDSYKSRYIAEITSGITNSQTIKSQKESVNSVKNSDIINMIKDVINSVNSINRNDAVTKNIKGEVESVKYEYYRRTTNQEINTTITTNSNRYTRRNANYYGKNRYKFNRRKFYYFI